MQERTVVTIVEGSDERQENLGGWGQQDQSPPMEAPAWPNYEPFSFYFEWQYGLQTVYLPGVDGVNRTDQRRKTLTEMFFAQLVAIVEPCQKSCVRAGALKITPTFYITPSPLPLGPRLKARTGHESPHQPTQYDNAQVKQMKKILDEQLHHLVLRGHHSSLLESARLNLARLLRTEAVPSNVVEKTSCFLSLGNRLSRSSSNNNSRSSTDPVESSYALSSSAVVVSSQTS